MTFSAQVSHLLATALVAFARVSVVSAQILPGAPPPPPRQGIVNAPPADTRGTWRLTELTSADPLPQLGPTAGYSKILHSGEALDPTTVKKLEATLKASPGDLDVRLQLIGYYAFRRNRFRDPEAGKSSLRLQLWLIENNPSSPVFRREPQLSVFDFKDRNDPRLSEIVRAWQKQVKAHPDNAEILENAAASLQMADYASTATYLKRLRQIEPTFPHIAVSLALVYTQAIARMTDPHGPLPPDGFGPVAQSELAQSNDMPVVGFTGEMLYMLGKMNGASKPYAATGESLLKRAQSLDPSNSRWSRTLTSPAPSSPGMIVAIMMTNTHESDLWVGGVAPEMKAPSGAVRVPADTEAKRLLHSESPNYGLAGAAVQQGAVLLRALISPEGRIDRLEVANGPLHVLPSVIDAVRNWTYAPTMIEGKPAEVLTDIALEFHGPQMTSRGPMIPRRGVGRSSIGRTSPASAPCVEPVPCRGAGCRRNCRR